jgi:hypothetical protein
MSGNDLINIIELNPLIYFASSQEYMASDSIVNIPK